MLSRKFLLIYKKKIIKLFLLSIVFHCVSVSAISLKSNCLKDHSNFISRYFSNQSRSRALANQLENFFDCIDNNIQWFLNHTPRTGNPNYYTQTELRRAMQFFGASRSKAEDISKAILNLKTGFIGGNRNRLTKTEIATCRKILFIFRQRMRALSPSISTLIQILNNQSISAKQLIITTEVVKVNLISMGIQLSKLLLSSNLSLLEHLPQNLKTLGVSNTNLFYWNRSLSLIKTWKKIFFTSPQNIIHRSEWPDLLQFFGELAALWFYHKRFLKDKNWLNTNVVQYTQYFISSALSMVQLKLKQSKKSEIFLQDIDELVHKLWFLPDLSQPVFRLAMRSTFCFLLNPLTTNNVCNYNTDFQQANLTIRFSDITFTITDTKKIYESRSGRASDRIQESHLQMLRKYLNSWIKAESQIHQGQKPDSLFGSPHQWLNRQINITSDSRLAFYVNRTNNIPLLSHLNWHSWLMKLVTSAYTKRKNKQVDQNLWNTMIKEWTALAVSIYKDMQWERFQKLGFKLFKHGDFLNSYSNGDGILQEEEILELFSFFTSSMATVLYILHEQPNCKNSTYYVNKQCIWDYLLYLPSTVFTGFPRLRESLSQNTQKKTSYINTLSSFYSEHNHLSIKDLFEMSLFIHYQENMMEYLDRNFSQDLTARELEPLLGTFEQTLIDDMPLINDKRSVYAFITYLFHFREVPIFTNNKPISAPMRFSNWHLNPARWEAEVNVDREDILHTLLLINRDFQ